MLVVERMTSQQLTLRSAQLSSWLRVDSSRPPHEHPPSQPTSPQTVLVHVTPHRDHPLPKACGLTISCPLRRSQRSPESDPSRLVRSALPGNTHSQAPLAHPNPI